MMDLGFIMIAESGKNKKMTNFSKSYPATINSPLELQDYYSMIS